MVNPFSKSWDTALPESFKPNSDSFIKLGSYAKIRYRLKPKVKDLTYILGARCKDGVVLVGDTKVIRGETEISHEYKIIQPLPNIVIGASGVSGIFHKFLMRISQIANQELAKGEYTAYKFVNDCEDVSKELTERYFPRVRDAIEVLIAFRAGNISNLYIVNPEGISEPVKNYLAIGHGEPYGSFFLKRIMSSQLTMEEMAKVGCFIIGYIEKFELDNSVGGSIPQIWFLPDLPQDFDKLSDAEKEKFNVREVNPSEIGALEIALENVSKINAFFNNFSPFSLK